MTSRTTLAAGDAEDHQHHGHCGMMWAARLLLVTGLLAAAGIARAAPVDVVSQPSFYTHLFFSFWLSML